MGNLVYQFGHFSLNPRARELRCDGDLISLSASAFDCLVYLIEHRERPVGRDELISAVWGRVDVSDSLLAQTVVRLRRALGDAGNEQHSIKTIARVGYRWMLETSAAQQLPAGATLEQDAASADASQPPDHSMDAPQLERKPARKKFSRWHYLLAAALLGIIAIASYAIWRRSPPAAVQASNEFNQGSAIVLPAEVDAPEDWKWLHFGLMDLISNRLRDARIPTETSQAVLDLLKEHAGAQGTDLPLPTGFSLVVRPHVTLTGDKWMVHLDAKGQDGRLWKAESSSTDVLKAARSASDLLLTQLGYGAQVEGERTSSTGQLEYMQRIDAARLAGQPAVARELIDKAPADLRSSAEMAYTLASLDCDEGKTASCEQSMLDLLKRFPEQQNPVVHGEILTSLGMIYEQHGDGQKSLATLSEAIRTLEAQDNHEALANAFLDRSYTEQGLWKLDEATSDLGRARVTYALAGDAVGAAKADFEMGLLADRRAQPDAGLGLLQRAYDQFQRMGMRTMLPSTLDGMADAQKMLLKFSDELATTDRFWPLDTHDLSFLDIGMRRELAMVRAVALADNGRTAEATVLAETVVREADPKQDAALIAETNKLLAEIALLQGDDDRAADLASKALTPALESDDQRDCASLWLTRISALQHAGHLDRARSEVASLADWHTHLPFKDDWVDIYVTRAKAAQSWVDGHHDDAIGQLKLTMASAEKLGVPELIVSVGEAYALALLDAGQQDQAMAVSGRLSVWSNTDWRAAWVEARVYLALGQTDSWNRARAKAQQLAGDRRLPAIPSGFEL